MNLLVSLQCAPRVFAALTVMAALLAALGCGSGISLIHPLPGGFSNASLSGQYVISQTGISVISATAAAPFSEVIVFTADGKGHVTGGVDDFNQSNQSFQDQILSSSYSIARDGTGTLIITLAGGSSNYAITMIDDSHFYIIEQDGFATASGYGEKQTATTLPTGNFVFKAHNVDTSSRVGGIAIAANGTVSGTEDVLNLGSTLTSGVSITGTTGTTNGSPSFTLSDGTSFFYYVISPTKIRFLSDAGTLEIGQAEAQSGTFSLATLAAGSSYVFGSSGDTTTSGAAGIHSAGVFTSDGAGHIISSGTAVAVDSVEDVTLTSSPVSGGSYTLDPASGRGQLNLTLSSGTIGPQIFWMVDGTRAYFLVDSATAVEDGTFTLQQPPPLNPVAMQAAFVMDGFDVAFKDRVGAFGPTSSSNFNWNQSANSFDPNPNDITFGGNPSSIASNGTFTASSNGRVLVTVNNVTSTPNGWVFYLSSASSGVMVQEDTNAFGLNDVGGAFTVQASQ